MADPDKLSTSYKSLRRLGTVLIGVPALIGAFWGAPLLARELETGTFRLAWTQTVTRQRWLATKLGVTSLAAVAVTATFSLIFTWWSIPLDHFGNRIGTATFGQRGIVPIAYALFALALGTLAGAILRRTLPAIAVTLVGFLTARYVFQVAVRPHLLTTVTATLPNNLFGQRDNSGATNGGWVLSSKTTDAAGHTVSNSQIDQIIRGSCHVTRQTTSGDLGRCATGSACTTLCARTRRTSSGHCRHGKQRASLSSQSFSPSSASGGSASARRDSPTVQQSPAVRGVPLERPRSTCSPPPPRAGEPR